MPVLLYGHMNSSPMKLRVAALYSKQKPPHRLLLQTDGEAHYCHCSLPFLLFNHDLFTIIDIDAANRRLATELATVERVPIIIINYQLSILNSPLSIEMIPVVSPSPLAVAFGAALIGFGSVGFEIRLLRVLGLTVRKIAFQMLIFTAVGFLRPFGSKPAELERQIRPSGGGSRM